MLSLSPHQAFIQFLSCVCGNLPVSLLLFPHRKGSNPGTGRGSSPRCQIQLMTQPRAEAVSWIYFGFQASLLPCFHLCRAGKGLFVPYTELYFPQNPTEDTDQAMLPGDMWVLPGPDTQECGQGQGAQRADNPLTAALISPTTQSWQIPAQPGSGPVMSPQSPAGSPCALIPAVKNSCY